MRAKHHRHRRRVQVGRELGLYSGKGNGGGGNRPRPFIVIAIWAGLVLVKNRGNTVIRAYVSSSIGIMHPYWGL